MDILEVRGGDGGALGGRDMGKIFQRRNAKSKGPHQLSKPCSLRVFLVSHFLYL